MTDTAHNPDLPCPHDNFAVHADINRILAEETDTTASAYQCDLKVWCEDCGEKFRFSGVQAGMSHARPMCSPDEMELRIPIRPASADPDFGMGLPGFAITWREGGQ